MDLMQHAVDEAFARLTRLYGRQFTAMFETEKIDEVKAAWLQEVRSLPRALDAIAWALRNLPERCPNAIQFRNLCRQAPHPHQVAMTSSSDPVRGPTPDELDELQALRDGVVPRRPSKRWATELLERAARGEHVSTGALRMAQQVVGAAARKPTGAALPAAIPASPATQFLADAEEDF